MDEDKEYNIWRDRNFIAASVIMIFLPFVRSLSLSHRSIACPLFILMINLSLSLPLSHDPALCALSLSMPQKPTIITDDGYHWVDRNDVHWMATIVILITFISCIIGHHMNLRQQLVGARMRIACSAAIYRKSLRMSKRAVTQTSAGNVVNLLSNDVSRLDYGFIFVHYIWILPIQGI